MNEPSYLLNKNNKDNFYLKGDRNMASFQKRGNTWQFTISRVINGVSKPIRKSGFKTMREAKIAATEIEAEIKKGFLVPELKPRAFSVYFLEWIEVYKEPTVNSNTYARYLTTYETVLDFFGQTPIQEITKRDYQHFLNKYGKTRTKESVKKLNSQIRACVQDAIDEGIIRTDFTRKVKFSGLDSKKDEEKYLNYAESQILLQHLYNNLDKGLTYYLLLLALTTGMRYAELVGLQRKDFDFVNNTITINKTWGYTRKMHKGFGKTKTESSNRTIGVDSKTMNAFKKLFLKTPENYLRLVFFSPTSQYHVLSNASCNKTLKRVLNDYGIDPITVHGLRHTHASLLLYKKISIYYVSERLGHSDIETTLSTYTHVLKELRIKDEKKTKELFGNMFTESIEMQDVNTESKTSN